MGSARLYSYISGIYEMVNHTNTSDERGCHNTERNEDTAAELGSRATKTDLRGLLSLGFK